jgi:hypothetical protein
VLRIKGDWALLCLLAVLFSVAMACATSSWPDEPGIPVALSHADNLRASEAFLDALTARRRTANLSAPLLTPARQSEIRVHAEELQAGKISAERARASIESWGQAAYGGQVDAWILDCTPPGELKLPGSLVDRGTAVIAYAAAQFHPVSMQKAQCAILVVAKR